ncbi:rab9 effector protein with kelch motifs [Spea bombifrons]|uniref:rab9 effector protein with kelch motifs n=1 Tax=Spea bombifrons TaxID=233779 RepID=UPI002349B652|nr:rab9 effector protein with kelch motifs [Spea bombifrons]XP_053328993.1 rab9 effector protein with kelch motifs [Spea bombifrons]
MELLEVLGPEDTPKASTWYTLVPQGEAPSSRVGHTCIYVPSTEESAKGKVAILAGANPGGCFSDAYILDLDSHTWDDADWEGLLPRYEHACFSPSSDPGSICVFGGAEQSMNRNCVQVLNSGTCSWKSPKVKGTPPSPRTFHTSSASIGDKLYVFGGGEKGAEPVEDLQLHVYDAATFTWTQPVTLGEPPKPRHGHVVAAEGTKLFIHGGMAGSMFLDDMFCIDTETMKWERLNMKGDVPPPCAAHSSVAWKSCIYIFGGMTELGATNSMYRFNTDALLWTKLEFDSPCPPARLDHSMCLLPWKIQTGLSNTEKPQTQHEEGDLDESSIEKEYSNLKQVFLCLIFGGMNTDGDLFSDCCVTMLQK